MVETRLRDLRLVSRGKVRDMYDLGAHLLIVTTDRISAFDRVLPNGIPDKGKVLNQLSAFWFGVLADVVPHHLQTTDLAADARVPARYHGILAGRSMIVWKAEVFPVECVARGYLIGSGWRDYRETGAVCGIVLPPGLRQASRLPQVIFTPATKAASGHDENIDFARMAEIVGPATAEELRRLTVELYGRAAALADRCGIIIADTKFEFGRRDGRVHLVDEALTPDSSRFWAASSYAPGQSPPSFDKQFVREWLETTSWDKNSPPPRLPASVIGETREKYLEALVRLTGQGLR
ncbi:MAG: phosphoribosylaminoimidazolesuccinocarboxamide synthase [Candidatus Rokuibacteriota bacterium]